MNIPQFGNPHGAYTDRPGAYAVIQDDAGRILTVFVRGRYHLPGGGINEGEDPFAAVHREIMEETGYRVESLELLGKANQFLETKDLGPINKLATYFRGRLSSGKPEVSSEIDHEVKWVSQEEFLSFSAHDFHKWAVERAQES